MARNDARDLYDGNPSGWAYADDPAEPENGKADWKEEGDMTTTCPECDRVFDLLDPEDAAQFAYGHDCEAPE